MEDRLKEAIEHALLSGDDPNTRIRALIGNDAFNLLDKPWKSIAITILPVSYTHLRAHET